jgi:hypothetical protein
MFRRIIICHISSTYNDKEAKVCYQYEESQEEVARMHYLEFIAQVTSHIPNKGQGTIRNFGL